MSHFTRVKTVICKIEPLKKALTDLDFKFDGPPAVLTRGQTVDIRVMHPKKRLEAGFVKNEDVFDLVGDSNDLNALDHQDFLPQLTQRYAYHVVRDQLESEGFRLDHETVSEGQEIHLVLRRMA